MSIATFGMYQPHEPVRLDPGPGRTKQSFADETNINIIMAKYEKTRMLDHLNKHEGSYGNFIAAPDYHTAMNQIREAGETFMEIPATIRAQFGNDPAQFLAFVQNPDNAEEMIKMGLLRRTSANPSMTEPPAAAPTPPATPEPAPTEPPSDA